VSKGGGAPEFVVTSLTPAAWGRCYDHNLMRFLPIFGEKIGVFLKRLEVMIKLSQKSSCSLSKKRHFSPLFCENIFKVITSVPGQGRDGQARIGRQSLQADRACARETGVSLLPDFFPRNFQSNFGRKNNCKLQYK
jgi:hypothetical protein